jgi:hypothetical protein
VRADSTCRRGARHLTERRGIGVRAGAPRMLLPHSSRGPVTACGSSLLPICAASSRGDPLLVADVRQLDLLGDPLGSQSLHFVGHALLLEAPQVFPGQLGDGEADSGSEVLPRASIHVARERPSHAHLVTGGIQLLGVRRDIRMSPKLCPAADPGACLGFVLTAPEPRWPRSSTWRSASPPRTPAMFAISRRCRPATSRSSRRRHGSCHCVATKQTRSSSTLRSWRH